MGKKVSAFILAGAVFLTSVLSDGTAVKAAQESSETVLPAQAQESEHAVSERAASDSKAAVTYNRGQQNYPVWSKTVKSYLMVNDDGTMTRVEYTGSDVAVEKYSSDGYLLSSRSIQMELPMFGGFYAGTDYNFLVVGQTNMGEDDTREVIRVIKYDKNWNPKGEAHLCGANTTVPFEAGSLRMAQSGDMLYVRTSHLMYRDWEGLMHQANLTFSVNISTMEVKEEDSFISNQTTGYVSHSFNQFIQVNGDKLLAVDHGDARPRGVTMFEYKSPAGTETGRGKLGAIRHIVEMLSMGGAPGDNYTGVSVGGFEYSDTHYLVAGNSIPLDEGYAPLAKRNIFVSVVPTDYSEAAGVRWFEFKNSEGVSTPQLVKINNQRFLMLWTVDGELCSVFLNADGSQEGELAVSRNGAAISDCQPIVVGDKVVWYVTENDVPLFYYIDLNSTTPKAEILNRTHYVTYDLMGGTMADDSAKIVEYGSPYGTLPTPTQSGRIFLGWYTDPTGGSRVTESSVVGAAGDETLYARWLVKESCGKDLAWDIEDRTLIIEGKGSMTNWNTFKAQPWYECRDLFDKVVIKDGVTSVGTYAFYNYSGIREITLPQSLSEIKEFAFSYCNLLENIEIPEQVKSIGDFAFKGCSGLTEIILPDGITRIESYVFDGCSSLKRIEIPDELTAICEYAFRNCASLESINIPLTVTLMKEEIFTGCDSGLKIFGYKGSIAEEYAKKYNIGFVPRSYTLQGSCGEALTWELKDGVMTIRGKGKMADFSWYTDAPWCDYRNMIEEVVIGDGVTSIAPFAFYNCRNLSSVTCSESVVEIGNQAFQYCVGLRNVKFPKNINSIGSRAFYGCSSLSSIILPEGLTEINWGLFGKCSGLEEITIPGSVTYIEGLAFEGHGDSLIIYGAKGSAAQTFAEENEIEFREISYQYSGTYGSHSWKLENGVLTISGNGEMIDVEKFSDVPWYQYRSLIERIVAQEGVTKIGAGAFYGCCNVDSVSLPASLVEIGNDAFRNCRGLTEIAVPEGVSAIGVSAFDGCSGLKSFRFPGSVTAVSNYQFYGCTSLTEVHLPEGLKTVGMYAFWGCHSLGSIEFTESLKEIGMNAFYGCTALRELEIPKTIATIPFKAFSGCSGLEKVTIPSEIQMIEDTAFENCGRLVIYGYKGSRAEEYATSHTIKFSPIYVTLNGKCGENLTWELKDGVLKIDGTGRMYDGTASAGMPWESYQTQIEKVVVADGVTYIGDYAFEGCSTLTEIVLPKDLKTIGTSAFRRCTKLVNIDLPQKLTVIGDELFSGCESLTGITIPENVTRIGVDAFYNCKSIERLTLPESVGTIGAYAFSDCSGLTEFTIPGSVRRLESGTFSGCGEMMAVTIPSGVTEINETAFTNCSKLEIYGFNDTAAHRYAANHGIPFHDLSSDANEGNVQLLKWKIEDGILTISGEGAMPDWEIGQQPWNSKNKLVKEVVIEEGITSVGNYAFHAFSGIRKVTLADSVKKIGNYAFLSCAGLTDIQIPFMTTSIGNYAFRNCSSLKRVQLFEGMAKIGEYAFQDCSSLESISIPKGVMDIGKNAFERCTRLSSVNLSEGLKTIGEYAFHECSSLQDLEFPDSVAKIGSFAFYGCTSLKNLVVPGNVTELEGFVFGGNKLDSITIPATVETIASTALNAKICYGWRGTAAETYADEKNMIFVDISDGYSGDCGDKVTWRLKGGTLTISGKGKMSEWTNSPAPWSLLAENIREVVIEEGVTSIMRDAFRGCVNLESVIVPISVDKIYDSAFLECSEETTIQGYQYTFAEQFAKENDIPFIVRYYSGEGAWGENLHWKLDGGVLTISGTGNMPESGATPWSDYRKIIKEVVIEEGVTSVRSSLFSGCPNIRKVEIADSVTTIGNSAFERCTSLEDVTLPNTITTITSGLFSCCYNLTKITIPDSVTRINNSAFGGCTGLKSIVIPAGVTVIRYNAFQNCSSLESIVLPEQLKEIEQTTFKSCKALKNIEIPESVKKIGKEAFMGCSELEGVRFPLTVASIDSTAFSECGEELTFYCAKNSVAKEYATENSISVSEYSYEVNGNVGENIAWSLKDGVLSVSGKGEIGNLFTAGNGGWTIYKEQIVRALMEEGITFIKGFSNCIRLRSVNIPGTVENIEKSAFEGCTALTEVRFYGDRLKLYADCFQNVTANGYYPINNPTWEGVSESFYGGTFTWEGFYPAEGTCGDLTWTLDGAGTLTIDGNGEMASYESEEAVPWYAYRDKIKRVVVGAGVESIGAYAFSGCTGITDIIFHGSMPAFGENAFYGVTAEACHPAGDSSWDHVEEEMAGGTLSWSDHMHIEEKDEAKAATCTEAGMTSGSHCSVCGKVFIQQMEIEPLGHLEKKVPGSFWEATCTTPGQTARIDCSRCQTTIKASEEIAAKGHQWEEDESNFYPPTCTNKGYRRHFCTVCADSWIEEIPKTAHNYIDGICCFCGDKEPGSDPGTTPTPDPGTTPTPEPGTTPTPDPGTTPTPDPGTTPTPEPGTTPMPDPGITPTPDPGATPTPDPGVTPTPDPGATPGPGSGMTPGPNPGMTPGSGSGTDTGTNPGTSICNHMWGAWEKVSEATVFAPEKQKGICVVCGVSMVREYGNALKPYIKLTANSLKMQVKQSTKRFKVTGMARGDWLASVKSGNTKTLKVSKVNRVGTFKLKAQKKTGTVKLTITLASGLEKTIKVRVGKAKVKTKKITVKPKMISLKEGKKKKLKPIIAPVTSQDKATYKSSNKKIVSVDAKGVITARKNGTAKITVASGKKKVIVTVKVAK